MNTAALPRPDRFALQLFGAAISLGALGEFLFSPGVLGLNAFLWTAALAVAVFALARVAGGRLRGEGRWLLPVALVFVGFVTWRSSPVLQAINIGTVVTLLAVAAFRLREGKVRLGAVTEFFWIGTLTACSVLIGLAELLFRDIDWRRAVRPASGAGTVAWFRGLAFAVPLLLIFGRLLASADALFSDAIASVFSVDGSALALHVGRAAVWTWIAGGFLHGALIQESEALPHSQPLPALRLGRIEVSTVLGALDLLFLAFVAFQVKYLFGGAGHVQVTDGLTYAEYARHGFFELLAVAALVLPLILAIHWLLKDSSPSLKAAFRILSAVLVLLVYVVIASSLQRMRVYVDEFGLTELRVYTTAVMVWLALVFVWLVLTVLRDRRERFSVGALAAGLAVVAALNVLNPDAFIVRTNLERAGGRPFDVGYALKLSPDATPTLVAALPRLSPGDQCQVANGLARQAPEESDWRGWNFGREQARDATDGATAERPERCPAP